MQKEIEKIINEIETVISGKRNIIKKIITAILSEGHVLLDDIPGVGKTTLAVALGKTMELTYNRIQFTPDVLPSDIVGFSIYNRDNNTFEYKPGIVTETNLLLGDEINRTSSKTQSALLEAMEENQVTVDGKTYPLKKPFTVIATQNNVGSTGTQLLPYAQMDRFLMRLSIGYPDHEAQLEILKKRQNANPITGLNRIISLERLIEMQNSVQATTSKDSILAYISQLSIASREHDQIEIGISPRGILAIDIASKANAFIEGRDYVVPEDVQQVFIDVCAHRIILSQAARIAGIKADDVLNDIIRKVPVPGHMS